MADAGSGSLGSLARLIADITNLKPALDSLIDEFRNVVGRAEKREPDNVKKSPRFWVFVVFADALVRLRLFVEQNFGYIEPMAILSVVRYTFELTIWLKHLHTDARYGLVYYRVLVAKQLDYYSDLHSHLRREIDFLRKIDEQEQQLLKDRAAKLMRVPDEETQKVAAANLIGDLQREIDKRAAREFSLYAEQARTNGYSFQAYLVEEKVLPKVAQAKTDLEKELASLDDSLLPEVRALLPKRKDWNWKDEAGSVGMGHEYDFIYTYTSRLLHATPASLTTDQKNLEPDEIRMFLRYIHVRLLDAMQMAKDLLAAGLATH
jgi:hypothetical protein